MTKSINHRISLAHGMSGWFAVHYADYSDMNWCPDVVQTGIGRYETRQEAIEEAINWSKAENLPLEI